jgi:hypothetical protein
MFKCNYKEIKTIKSENKPYAEENKRLDTTESDEKEEEECSTTSNSGKSSLRYSSKIYRKKSDVCYALNMYDQFGKIICKFINEKVLAILKIRYVDFPDSNELFEKGKNNLGNYFKEDSRNIPDITFWYQRYYYYKKFDEGIKMDLECM